MSTDGEMFRDNQELMKQFVRTNKLKLFLLLEREDCLAAGSLCSPPQLLGENQVFTAVAWRCLETICESVLVMFF